ncbi:Origin recognition complex subunit 4, partial [Operophtera brumata]
TTPDTDLSIPEEVLLRCRVNPSQFNALDPLFVLDWNAHVRSLVDDERIQDSIEKFCYYTVNEQAFRNVLTVPRPVILKAFEHLQALEVILPVRNIDSMYSASETTATRVQKEYKLFTLAVPVEDINPII